MRSITLTVCDRPDYTRQVLESLRLNKTNGYVLYVGAEPGCEETLQQCRKIDFMPVEIIVNERRLGVNFNNKSIYEYAFAHGSECNVAIEDDTPLAPDALDLANWFFRYEQRGKYLLLNLFNGSRAAESPLELVEHSAFCPWGFCMTRLSYQTVIGPHWMCDERGWDWSICKIMRQYGLKALSPLLSRSRNIGKLKGVYCTPEYHDKCFSGHVASAGGFGNDFRVRALTSNTFRPEQYELICLTSVRDEGSHLGGFFEHLRDHVDGFLVIDDGSTDSTREIILQEPKVLACHFWRTPAPAHFRESFNRFTLVRLAAELGIRWALYLDADERAEESFLRSLRELVRAAEAKGASRISVAYRELWDSPDRYRVDGIWGKKRRVVAFTVPEKPCRRPDGELHARRNPPEMDSDPVWDLEFNVYHLSSIHPHGRNARRQKYEFLDPGRRWQSIGYTYLNEESGLALEGIPKGKEYTDASLTCHDPQTTDRRSPEAHTTTALQLSIILPFYRRCSEFERVLKLNCRYFSKPHIEVILSLDDESETGEVCELIDTHTAIKWKLLVRREKHEWRPPAKAINVGIRNAAGEDIMIASPESAFVGDVPTQMLTCRKIFPDAAICGRLNYCRFSELGRYSGIYEAMVHFQQFQTEHPQHYGSICLSRRKAAEICGYDECLTKWGGDDDNFRARLQLAGLSLMKTNDINIVHLSFESRNIVRPQKTQEELDYLLRPKQSVCPKCSTDWGNGLVEVVRDWSSGHLHGIVSGRITSASD